MKKKMLTGPILSIIAGVLILVFNELLAWIVGLYLIINGILRLR